MITLNNEIINIIKEKWGYTREEILQKGVAVYEDLYEYFEQSDITNWRKSNNEGVLVETVDFDEIVMDTEFSLEREMFRNYTLINWGENEFSLIPNSCLDDWTGYIIYNGEYCEGSFHTKSEADEIAEELSK